MKFFRFALALLIVTLCVSQSKADLGDWIDGIIEDIGESWDDIWDNWKDIVSDIGDAFEDIGNWTEEKWNEITNKIDDLLTEAGVGAFVKLLDDDLENIVNELRNDTLLNQSSLYQTIAVMDIFNQTDLADVCEHCMDFVEEVRDVGEHELVRDLLKRRVEAFCAKRLDSTFCTDSVQTFGDIVLDSIMFEGATTEYVCQRFALCSYTTDNSTLVPYVEDVMQGKPNDTTTPPPPANRTTYTVLHVTDVHIDFQYQEGTNAFCGGFQCCREENGIPENTSNAAGYWGSLGTCDIPYRTFDQFARFASQNFNISKIIWTGDNIDHQVWEQTRHNQTFPTFNITEELLRYFPSTVVLPMFGNHEGFPSDQFDTVGEDSEWLLQELGEMWGEWLTEEALETFTKRSFYSEVDHARNLKTIVLDTQTCDTLNFYLVRDNPTDPLGQLAWLREQLAHSEANNQSVWILGHIPPGHLNCDPQWSERYRALVDRYSAIIKAQFFGHTHNDQFQVMRSFQDDTPIGVQFVAPSLSTYTGLNPSFRIFEFDAETNEPVNYYQYRLNLTKWNQNTTGPIEWDLAYNFLEQYNLTNMSAASFDSLAEQIRVNETATIDYVSNFAAGGMPSLALSEREIDYLYCYAKYGTPEAIMRCLDFDAGKQNLLYFTSLYVPGLLTSDSVDQENRGH